MNAALGFVLALLLLTLPLAASTPWTPIVALLEKSVVAIATDAGACTGFVINEEKHYVLTAAHCDGKDIYADNEPAKVVSKDVKKDLMVLEVKDLDRPALALAKENPKVGDEVASFGYGYALERPLFRVVHISDDRTYIPHDGIGGPLLVIDATFVPGQSGGPVVDTSGAVVMLVQLGTDRVGMGAGAEIIHAKVGRFFGRKK